LGVHIPARLQRSAWKTVRDKVVARDGRKCQDCGKDLSSVPRWLTEVHHIAPKAKGGSDHPCNLKTLCVMCHRRYTDDMTLAACEAYRSNDLYRVAENFRTGYWSEGRETRLADHDKP
jgi:5-methylcytosine-specific restriction endonuclease McrA